MNAKEHLDYVQKQAEAAATRRGIDRKKLKALCEQQAKELKEKNKCAS